MDYFEIKAQLVDENVVISLFSTVFKTRNTYDSTQSKCA